MLSEGAIAMHATRITKELVPSDKNGEILKQKMIDYAVTLVKLWRN